MMLVGFRVLATFQTVTFLVSPPPSHRRDSVFGKLLLLPGRPAAGLCPFLTALCEIGQWRGPHLRLQHSVHGRGGPWHK